MVYLIIMPTFFIHDIQRPLDSICRHIPLLLCREFHVSAVASLPGGWRICQFQCNIVYNDTKKSLENDIGARTFDSDKSAPHFSSFQIETECTIKRPVYFKFSQQFKLPKHRFKLRTNAQLSALVFWKRYSGVTPPTPTNFLFRINFILPTLRPWSQALRGYGQYGWSCQISLAATTNVNSMSLYY